MNNDGGNKTVNGTLVMHVIGRFHGKKVDKIQNKSHLTPS
jgi:hypothetical protein